MRMLRSYFCIPDAVFESLVAHAREGRPAGGFVTACLENDLVGAFHKADTESRAAMPQIAAFIWNEMPRLSWGSRERVETWRKAKAIEREARAVAS